MADGPDNYEARGVYTGPVPLLKGYEADLIVYRSTGRCLAKFDDLETGYAFGWHDFSADDFNITPKED